MNTTTNNQNNDIHIRNIITQAEFQYLEGIAKRWAEGSSTLNPLFWRGIKLLEWLYAAKEQGCVGELPDAMTFEERGCRSELYGLAGIKLP